MDIEPEVARQQMDDTRASLTDKLGTLEQHVVDTVQGATDAVADTVENVKDAVHETVENVKDTLNISLQVRRHPWGMMVGSVALGYLGGYLLYRAGSARAKPSDLTSQPPAPDRVTTPPNGVSTRHRSAGTSGDKPAPEAARGPSEPGWLSGAKAQFGPEITKLKELVVGTVLSAVRDMITQAVSEPMKAELANVMDSITVKLGGEPTQVPESKNDSAAPADEPHEIHESNTSEKAGAVWEQLGKSRPTM